MNYNPISAILGIRYILDIWYSCFPVLTIPAHVYATFSGHVQPIITHIKFPFCLAVTHHYCYLHVHAHAVVQY